jgi:hypothetical protein
MREAITAQQVLVWARAALVPMEEGDAAEVGAILSSLLADLAPHLSAADAACEGWGLTWTS